MLKPYYENDHGKLYCGDCLQVMQELIAEGVKVDAVVTDPPYGIAYESGQLKTVWSGQIAGDKDTWVRDQIVSMFSGLPMLLFGSWKATRPAGTRMILTWDKGPALGMGALDLPWKPCSEEIYVIGRGFCGQRDEGNVLYCPPVQSMAKNGRVHPNEKPVELMERLIRKVAGETILDPFAGSGTTLVAAQSLGRKWIGIEISPEYCEIAKRRLEGTIRQIEGQTTLFDAGRCENP